MDERVDKLGLDLEFSLGISVLHTTTTRALVLRSIVIYKEKPEQEALSYFPNF